MKLTIANRLRLCWEILTIRSNHRHSANEKQLSTFMRGYGAGYMDGTLSVYQRRSHGHGFYFSDPDEVRE